MRRMKTRVSPSVDIMESRVLLSTAAPMIARPELRGMVRDVRAIMGMLGRTGDTVGASVQLTALAWQVPSGPEFLAPRWRADLGLYSPNLAGSVAVVRKRILADLHRFVQGGGVVGHGPGPAPGPAPIAPPSPPPNPGGSGTTPPAPAASLDSVNIQNNTGLAIRVTIYLEVAQVQKPWITQTIPAQGSTSALFNFGTATGAFMTMTVSRADGGLTPPPLPNYSLPQPMTGYNGTLFSISLLGPYFNVTAG